MALKIWRWSLPMCVLLYHYKASFCSSHSCWNSYWGPLQKWARSSHSGITTKPRVSKWPLFVTPCAVVIDRDFTFAWGILDITTIVDNWRHFLWKIGCTILVAVKEMKTSIVQLWGHRGWIFSWQDIWMGHSFCVASIEEFLLLLSLQTWASLLCS